MLAFGEMIQAVVSLMSRRDRGFVWFAASER